MILNDMSIIIRYNFTFMNRSLSNTNISANENYMLMYLFDKGEVTQDEISSYFGIDKGSISKTVSSLESKGYIEKKINQDNKRSNLVYITKKGIQTFKETKKLLDMWHKDILNNISSEELDILTKTLSTMARNAEKALGKDTTQGESHETK